MPETFSPIIWRNDQSPALNESNLNRLEQGVELLDDRIATLELGVVTPVVVPYATSVTLNATQGSLFRCVAPGDLTLDDIVGGTDGQVIVFEVQASGADRALHFTGSTETVTISAGQWWVGQFRYVGRQPDGSGDIWLLNDGSGGNTSGGSGNDLNILAPQNIPYAATVTPNAAIGALFRVTAVGDVTLADPINGTDGQAVVVEVLASGGQRTVTLSGGQTSPVTVASGTRWVVSLRYNATATAWVLTSRSDLAAAGSGGSGSDTTTVLYSRGVNLAGAEFSPDNAHLPGTYSTDYAYPATTEINAMAARGHKVLRIPFRWERIQPTRGAALNATELGRLTAVTDAAAAAGASCVLDVHNYARYINSTANGGAELILGSTLPVSDFVDLWTRLSAAFKGRSGVHAYGLMNEPHDLTPVVGSFSGTVRYDWASGVQGWTGDTATASNVSGQLRLSKSVGAGTVNMRKDDAATVSGGSTPTGTVLRAKMTLVAGSAAGTWTAHLEWQNSSFIWQSPSSTSYIRVDNGTTVSGLISGVPVYVTSTFTSIASPPTAFAVQVDGTGVTAGTVTVDVDDFSQGSSAGAKTPAQVWEDATQQAVTAIRGAGDTTKILVAGYGWSSTGSWTTYHSTPWVSDSASNHAYEAHLYFDADHSGTYTNSYATDNATATTQGYASLPARVLAELATWTTWLNTYGVAGFLGEVGWPDNADAASWNAIGEALYDALDVAKVSATYWAAGARWGTSYNLSAYTGTNQDTVKAQASVIEAHPTTNADVTSRLDDLDQRVTALETGSSGAVVANAAPAHRGPAFMVIGADTAGELTSAKNAGATHGLVEVFWDQVQSTAGGAVTTAGALANIQRVLDAGLKVCLRVSLQYPPSFVQTGAPKFKNQAGTDWTGTQANGDNIRDWVWSATGRGYVKDLLSKLFAQLDWSKIERCQLGGLRAGELSFPVSDGTVWWGYSAPAQTGTDLAARMAVCPVPSYTPSTGTTWVTNDIMFVGWYAQSMINWMTWLIEQHRRWFSGPIYVMHPGFGLREVSMTPTGSAALAYREQNANGLQWAQQIGCYPDDNCHPYSTWVNAAHSGGQPYSDTNDGDAAPWLHLLRVARKLGRGGQLWGENTGGQTNTDMDTVFQTGALAHGYEGVAWLSADSLSDGTSDTYANLTTRIAAIS